MIGVQGPAARDSTTQETNQRKKTTAINSELLTPSPTPKEEEERKENLQQRGNYKRTLKRKIIIKGKSS